MKKLIPSYVRVPVIFAMVFAALEYFIDSGDHPAFIKYPMVLLFLGVFLFFLIAIEILVSAVDNVTYHLLTEEQKNKLEEVQSIPFTESKFYKGIMKKLTRSKEIEQEADVMLDHDYDGIKELDNVLPPWWVYLFYGTIVFGLIYMVRFQLFDGNSQTDEYKNEVAQAEVDMLKNSSGKPADEMNADKVILLTDAASLAKGKEIFSNACVACHKADGGGIVGPNLTDEYWINGGGIKNVFTIIAEGSKNNPTMVSWKKNIAPTDIQKIASYVLSLQRTNPPGAKPAEGEKWVEEVTPKTDAKPATDSTKVVTKEVAVK